MTPGLAERPREELSRIDVLRETGAVLASLAAVDFEPVAPEPKLRRSGVFFSMLRNAAGIVTDSYPFGCGPPLAVVVMTGYEYVAGTARLLWPSGHVNYRELYNLDPTHRVFVVYNPGPC